MFSPKDLAYISQKGISNEVLHSQIQNFNQGFPFMDIVRPATIGDGILKIEGSEFSQYLKSFEKNLQLHQVCKFVPASGAASRMFKGLFAAYQDKNENIKEHVDAVTFLENLSTFAFYEDLKAVLTSNDYDLGVLLEEENVKPIFAHLLTGRGLDYGNLPKGLLKFHHYPKQDTTRTPFEEHLTEGVVYAQNTDGKVYLHFTVSPEHRSKFESLLEEVRANYENHSDIKLEVGFSEQHSRTDTIAVEMNNKPFRLEGGTILFRPGGHGALIENLNELEESIDIVFIKNIDNVVPDYLKETTYEYKKLIGGLLMDYQAQIFDFLRKLEGGTSDEQLIEEVAVFLQSRLFTQLPEDFNQKSTAEKGAYLFEKLNRPTRICGMVKNEGEPGGGPFWTKNEDGSASLQIVESAQINKEDASQIEILQASSHFNPVDLVCALRDYKRKRFNLLDYRDPKTGFIANKSKDGRELKAQELPGLWNGAMANWNTVFVEVPVITFNPVKTVNDLLRKEHLS